MEIEKPQCLCQSAWNKLSKELSQLKAKLKSTCVRRADEVGTLNEYTKLLKSQLEMKSNLEDLEMGMEMILCCKSYQESSDQPVENSPEHLLGPWRQDFSRISAEMPRFGLRVGRQGPVRCSLSDEDLHIEKEVECCPDGELMYAGHCALVYGFQAKDAPLIESMFCQMAQTLGSEVSPNGQWAIFSYATVEGLNRAVRHDGAVVNGRKITVTDNRKLIHQCRKSKNRNAGIDAQQASQNRGIRRLRGDDPCVSPRDSCPIFHQITGWRKIVMEMLNF